jgi:hypothetical protein
MKKSTLILLLILGFSCSMKAQESVTKETGKIYFLRSTGFALWDSPFKTFIDGKLICKLNNNKYSIHDLSEGIHECSVQFYGTKSKEKSKKFKVTILPGKITYVQLSIEVGFAISTVYCEEVTENTAKQKMEKMKEDIECL